MRGSSQHTHRQHRRMGGGNGCEDTTLEPVQRQSWHGPTPAKLGPGSLLTATQLAQQCVIPPVLLTSICQRTRPPVTRQVCKPVLGRSTSAGIICGS